jgi:CheY-like chemotaxis protein
MLREAGYVVEGVYSGRAALAFLGPGRSYDLFILDVRLPDMSGLTLAHLIAGQHAARPFLFVSGFPDAQGEKPPDARWSFLGKPFSRDQLQDAVLKLLGASWAISPPAS